MSDQSKVSRTQLWLALHCMSLVSGGLAYAQTATESIQPTKQQTTSAQAIVVTASGFEQEIKDAPASISVITQEDLKSKPFRDVTDALKDIPGVTITGGGGGTDISLRGMGAKYTLILVDGKRQSSRETRPNSDGPGIEQGWIPPLSAIERIEVIRGPMSSLYGSDAMGGVINIITRKVSHHWMGSFRTEATLQHSSQSGHAGASNFYLNGPIVADTLGLQVYGSYSLRDEDQYPGGFPERRLNNLNGKLTYTPNEKHSIDLELNSGLQKRLSHVNQSAQTRASEHKSRRESQAVHYAGDWSFMQSDFSVTHEKTNNYSRQMIIDNTHIDGNLIIPFAAHIFTVGAQYRHEKLDDKGNQYDAGLSQLSRWSYAGFIEDEWQMTDRFALTMGLRYDYDENHGAHWNPRVYGVWNMTDTLTMKGGVSTGFSAPALRYVVADWGQVTGGGQRNGVILGNPDLIPEKTTNYELSLNYADDNEMTASITGFYTVFKDKIQSYYECNDLTNQGGCLASNGQPFDFIQSRSNVDKANLKGLELTVYYPFLDDFSLESNYTLTKTEQQSGANKGKPLNRIPEHQLSTTLNWQMDEGINVWVKGRYNGKETQLSRDSMQNYPGYSTWDMGTAWKINKQNTLYAGIYNIGDKTIRDDNLGKVDDGRRYWLGLNIDF